MGLDPLEERVMRGHRWWSASEIAASDAVFVPRRLARFLPPLIAGELPAPPIAVGA